jgi:hypothetical protein
MDAAIATQSAFAGVDSTRPMAAQRSRLMVLWLTLYPVWRQHFRKINHIREPIGELAGGNLDGLT